MVTAKKEPLKSLPQTQIGVSERGNIRMKKLAAPYCPVEPNPARPRYTGDRFPEATMSCQQEFSGAHGWWEHCEARGHEPYFTIDKRVIKEDVVDDDGLVTGTRKRVITLKRLNIVQVAIGTRFHGGRGETISKFLKGRKELSDFGYNALCEYRNCELDAKLKSKYGMFCGDRHARLIGADVEAVMLSVKGGEKNKQLRDIDIDFEGSFVLQAPPDLDSM